MAMDNSKFKILVVDDQPSNLRCLSNMLIQQGYKVQRAISGQLALNAAIASLPDLILLDIVMPEMNGYEVCERLKDNELTKDIPVIFLSVLDEARDKVKAFKVGGVDYIPKPFQMEEVLARIENQLAIRKLQQQLEAQNRSLQQEIEIRKQAEEELKATKDSLELVLCASNDGFWEWNWLTGEVYFSPRFKEMLGYGETELPDELASWEKVIDEEDKIAALKLIEDYNCDKVPEFIATQRFHHKNGSTVYFLARAIHLIDENGQISRMIFSHTDVTNLVKTTDALAESQCLLSSVLNNSQDGVMALASVRNEKGNIVDFKWLLVNRAAEQMIGRPADSLVGQSLLTKMPGHREIGLFDLYVRLVETGETLNREVYYNDEGIQAWLQIVAVKLGDGLAVTFRDITKAKQAQEALLMARKRLEYLLFSSPSIIYTRKPTTEYSTTFISQNITASFGYEPREFIKNSSFWSEHIHPEDKERVFAEISQLFTQGDRACEYRFLHKNGTYRWIYDAVRLVRDKSGNPIEMIGSWLDITELKQAQEALQNSQRFNQAVAEAHPNILYVYDLLEERNVYTNREIGLILGYTPEEVRRMGKNLLQTLMHPDDFALLGAMLQRFETAKDGEIFEFEYRMRHKNGEWHWLYSRETVFNRTADGKPKQILGAAADVSDRKQVEAALQESQRFIQALAEANPNVLYVHDLIEQRNIYSNREVYSLLEYTPEEIQQLGTQVMPTLMHPDDLALFPEHIKKFETAKDGEIFEFEYRMRHKNGEYRWFFSRDTVFARTPEGKPKQLLGAATNITERKQAEVELRQQKEILQTIFDHIPVMISLYDTSGQMQLANREMEKVLGWSSEEIKKGNLIAECYPDPAYRQQVLEFMLNPTGKWQDFKTRTHSGEIIDTTWANIRLSDGKTIGIGQDITERKQAEEALQLSEERFQLAIDNSGLGLWDWNISTGEVYFSDRWKTILGYEVEEIENTFAAWEQLVHPEDLPIAKAALTEHFERRSLIYEVEFRMLSKSGEWRWILSRAKVTEWDDSGKPVRMTGTHKDISDRKHTEAALHESERRFRAIFNNTFQLTGLLTPDGITIEANQTALNFANINHNDIVGRPFWEARWWTVGMENQPESLSLTPAQAQLKAAIAKAANGEFVRYEVDIRGTGDITATIDFSLKPVRDETGEVVLLISEGRDISDRKRAELVKTALINCLEQSEARLSQIVTTISEGLIVQDENYQILFINSAALALLGRSYEDLLSQSLGLPIIDGESTEVDIVRPTGELLLAEMRTVSITWDNKAAYLVTLRDITERKQAEAALQDSQARLQKLAANVPGMIYEFRLDPDGSFSFPYVSSGCREINELEPEDLLNNPELGFGLCYPEDRQKLYNSISISAQTLEPWIWEGRCITPSGKQKWIQGAARPERCEDGGILWHGLLVDVTARQQAEEALRQSEARLQKLTASVPGMIYEFLQSSDGSYSLPYVSCGCREIYELEPEQIVENAALGFERIHPDDLPSLYTAIHLSAQTLEPFAWEGRLLLPSGKLKWAQATSRPERKDNGEIVWHGLMIDVSDRKFSDALLRESQQRLAFLIQQTPLAIIEWNNNLEIIAWNPAAEAIFGYNQSEVLGRHILDLLVPKSARERVNQIADDLVNLRGGTYCVNDNITKNGRIIICEWYNTALIDENGNIIGGASMAVDITEREKAQEALRESADRERAIARAIERMRQTLDIDLIFRATTTELRQAINCDRVAIYRFNPDWSGEFVAESVMSGWTSVVQAHQDHPNLTEGALDSARCIVKTLGSDEDLVEDSYLQTTQGGVYSQGARYLCVPDIYQAGFALCYIQLLQRFQARAYITVPIFCGNKLWGLLATYQNSGPRQWEDAEINVVVQIGNQLGVALQQAELLAQTQRQSIELMQAKDAADAANRAKSQFLAHMSHELRTPLNAILGFSQILTRSDTLTSEQLEQLGIINRSGEHLLDLINDILSMSKIEAGQIALNENRFDLYRLLGSIEEMFQLKANSKGLELKCELDFEVPQYIQTDESKLRQVLINLLGNAIKFTASGSITLRARTGKRETLLIPSSPLEGQPQGDYPYRSPSPVSLVFEIEDTGPGIAPEELPSLFKPFVQTQTGRQSMQGTGLGLPISQQFVRLMGGEIGVSSQLGMGTTFTFNIQITPVFEPNENTVSVTRRVIGLQPNQPTYRLLIVEDVPANRQLLVQLLVPLGFEVREAENGQEGVALWESWQPHLIWMDMEMPVINGYEATRQIKASPQGQNTIIIALTASAFEEQRLAILQAGCDDFVCKPFQEEVLFEIMARYLGVQYIYQENWTSPSNRLKAQSKALTSQDLSVMSTDWIVDLNTAALAIDDQQILQLLQQIPENHLNLRKSITDLIENFRMDIIIELTQPYTNE